MSTKISKMIKGKYPKYEKVSDSDDKGRKNVKKDMPRAMARMNKSTSKAKAKGYGTK